MSRNTNFIFIDGEKFKSLLEGASGKTIKELSIENGFSNAFLRMVVKTGKASPTAQAVARLYGIEPSAYEKKPEPTETAPEQLTIDDINGALNITRDELKAIVKEAVKEAVNEIFNEGSLTLGKNGNAVYRAPSPATEYLKSLSENNVK